MFQLVWRACMYLLLFVSNHDNIDKIFTARKYHVLKTHRRVEVKFHTFLKLAWDEHGRWMSHSDCLQIDTRKVEALTRIFRLQQRESFLPLLEIEPRFEPITSHYTAWDILFYIIDNVVSIISHMSSRDMYLSIINLCIVCTCPQQIHVFNLVQLCYSIAYIDDFINSVDHTGYVSCIII